MGTPIRSPQYSLPQLSHPAAEEICCLKREKYVGRKSCSKKQKEKNKSSYHLKEVWEFEDVFHFLSLLLLISAFLPSHCEEARRDRKDLAGNDAGTGMHRGPWLSYLL